MGLILGASVPSSQPGSSPITWDWNLPTLQDETDLYNALSLTIPSGASDFSGWADPPGYSFAGNIHSNTEGDVLWAWYHQLARHGVKSTGGGSDTQDWYDDVLDYFKNNLLSEIDDNDSQSSPGAGFGLDHLYGQGLATVYNDTGDASIPAVMDGIRTRLIAIPEYQTLDGGGDLDVATFEGRNVARWTIVSAFWAEASGDSAWIAIRDNLAHAYETSPDWEEGGVIENGGGMYFASRSQAGFVTGSGGTTEYDAGRRFHSSFQVGLMAEAMWRCYIQTGSLILRERLIKMARYVQWYAHRPSWSFPNVGSRFGHEGDGSRWYIGGDADGTFANASTNPSYDGALVNLMVIGYKLTGETDMRDFARTLLLRSNRWAEGSPYGALAASDSHLYKYVDTEPNPSDREFNFNKGILQYSYQVFENGGLPSTIDDEGPIQTLAQSMASNTWSQLSLDDANFKTLSVYTGGTGLDRSLLEFAIKFFWNASAKELHIRGGGASGGNGNAQRHLRYSELTGLWEAVTPWASLWTHQWGTFTGDHRTGDLYFRPGVGVPNTDIYKWSYERRPATVSEWPLYATGDFNGSVNAQAMEYFPDLNSGAGGLVFISSNGDNCNVWAADDNSAVNWTQVGSDVFGAQALTVDYVSAYWPGQQWIVYGGGKGEFDQGFETNFEIGKCEADGTCTQLNTPPFHVGCGGSQGYFVGFPNGRVFGIDVDNEVLYEYNEGADSWSSAGLPALPFDAHWSAFAAIPEYGVLYCAAQLGSAASDTVEHWLYKL